MKKFLSLTISILLCINLSAQNENQKIKPSPVQLDSTSTSLLARISQHTGQGFKLYKTQNTWTFLELDTFTGRIWQVQYSVEGSEYRFSTILNFMDLTNGDDDNQYANRFELYPTDNLYNFILLDTCNGRTWQVQWSTKAANRGIFEIN